MAKSGLLKEFKEFALKGNVMDMAIGVIIGGAFGKIITSLVNDILMPPIGWLLGGTDFTKLSLTFPQRKVVETVVGEDGLPQTVEKLMDPVTWNYGNFLQVTIDFLIVSICIFLVVKGINKLSALRKKEQEEAPAPAPEPTKEEVLLTEIRDLLKEK
ncbi:MAG: large-conductance mechanosensitive channel protein MscL [Bacteroidales bacterium]|nr:large-conductance mechanosensitive channel protein MscL [Bacteroidales bacterium]